MELSQNGMEWGVLGSEDRHCVHTRVFKHFEACFDAAIALYMGVYNVICFISLIT